MHVFLVFLHLSGKELQHQEKGHVSACYRVELPSTPNLAATFYHKNWLRQAYDKAPAGFSCWKTDPNVIRQLSAFPRNGAPQKCTDRGRDFLLCSFASSYVSGKLQQASCVCVESATSKANRWAF